MVAHKTKLLQEMMELVSKFSVRLFIHTNENGTILKLVVMSRVPTQCT